MNIPGKWVMISRLKETLYVFLSFYYLCASFSTYLHANKTLQLSDLEICYSQCLGQIRCCRIWTLFPLNIRYLVFPTMCVFLVLGIHLSERMTMARVSLSAGSNFTDLWWARRLWFDQVPFRIIGIHLRSYNNPGLCSYRPHGIKNGLPRRYCLKKKKNTSNFYLLQEFLQALQYQSHTESVCHWPRTSVVFLSFFPFFFTHILIKLSCTRSWYCSCFASLSAKLPSI